MFKTVLVNFGGTIYEGADQVIAIVKAQQAGFEAIVYSPDGVDMWYSPISGWRAA